MKGGFPPKLLKASVLHLSRLKNNKDCICEIGTGKHFVVCVGAL